MMETVPNTRRIAALCMLGFLLVTSLPAAQFMERYRNGLNALEDGRLGDAERYFLKAIKEKGNAKIRMGTDYLPYYYLGVTLAQQNRCREALRVWEQSESQGQIQKAPKEGPELAGRKQKCIDRVRALDAAQRAAEQAVAQARKAAQMLAKLRNTPELQVVWVDGSPSFKSREQSALQWLEKAASRLGAAANAQKVSPFQDARTLANQSANELDRLMSDAQARLETIRSTASSALERLEAAEQKAHSALGQVTYLKPYPPGLKGRVDAVQSVLGETVKKKASASSDELDSLHGALTAAVSQLRKAAQGPPQSLLNAAGAILAGRYDEVLATLDGVTYRDPRASGQACLLRSAARHALYVSGGEEDFETGTVLYQEVLKCQALLPATKIKTTFFSPRFISFYEDPAEPQPPESQPPESPTPESPTPESPTQPEDPGMEAQEDAAETAASTDEAAAEPN